jgi:nitrate reductase gamma subunit
MDNFVCHQNRPSKQSRTMSFVEAITNVVVGFVVALLTQAALFSALGLEVTAGENLLIGAIFTAVSIVRSFLLRRLFEEIRVRRRFG